MSDPGIIAVRIVKGDRVFHVHGDRAGEEGVWLAAGQVHGLYEAPVRTTWKTGAFQDGSWQKARKWLHRDITLGFHIRDTFTSYELNDSLFRQMFDYELDRWELTPAQTTIEVETHLSGIRKIDVLMYEAPEFDPDIDPLQNQYGNYIFKLRAGQPFWYSDDIVSTFTDTTTSSTGTLTAENPSDQIAYQKFVLTRGTWTLPDVQWVNGRGLRVPGGPNKERSVSGIVVSTINGGAVVDLDRQNLMFRDANDTNILAQLAGKFFNYAIPPYTPATTLDVSYASAPAGGAMVRLLIPQRWSRPWGLELPSTDYLARAPYVTIFTSAKFRYVIPDWCDAVDVVMLGGGGGGAQSSTASNGLGGQSGDWTTVRLVRGTDIPWDTVIITGTVGQGGAGGRTVHWLFGGNHTYAATDGTATTATATGMTPLTAAGGTAGAAASVNGEGAASQTLNDRDYVGGAAQTTPGHPGIAPGGGGAGGWRRGGAGGKGARGQIWLVAVQTT